MSDLLRTMTRNVPVLRKFYHAAQDCYKLMKRPQRTPLGFLFSGNPLMEKGDFEISETQEICHCLESAEVFVNIGANAGYYCCLAQSKGVHTLAFEPFPRNIRLLKKNLKSNGYTDIEIFPLALSNQSGSIELFGFGTGASTIEGWAGFSRSYRTVVPCDTLDHALNGRLKGKRVFILVDIEGAERFMLEGALNILKNDPPPVWMVEISVSELLPEGQAINPHLLQTFNYFFDSGYQAFTLGGDEITTVQLEKIVADGFGSLGSNSIIFR